MTHKPLSRSAIERYIRCPRCFYLERQLGVKLPSTPPLTLAVATDALLKQEFDEVRTAGARHALWEREKLNVRGYTHPELDTWRYNFRGIRVVHPPTGVEVFGAVDDIWQDKDTSALHVVDYKSTSKQGTPSLDGGWGDSYKRQAEIYQWLLRQQGLAVHPTAYFLYVNASKAGTFFREELVGTMTFAATLVAYTGDDSWVDGVISAAVQCLEGSSVPASGDECEHCRYYSDRARAEASGIA